MTTTVFLDLRIDPARLDDAPAVVDQTLVATRAWPGNEGIEVVIDDADPTHWVVVETWATTADHDAYAAWRTTPEGANELGQVVAAAPVKTVFSERVPLSD